jgi:hypothetical protein
MRTLIVPLLFLAGIAMYIFWRTRRDQGIRRKTIAVADVGEVFRQISAQGVETSFAVFAFRTGEEDEDDALEIQFSVEDGKTGLDWILMSPANIEEKPKVIQYAVSKGVEWQEKEMNDWLYLRIEQGDVVGLCTSLIEDFYQVEQVELKYGGFTYKA